VELLAEPPFPARIAKIRKKLFQRRQASGMNQAQQSHFQMYPRIGLAPQIIVGLQKNIEERVRSSSLNCAAAFASAGR